MQERHVSHMCGMFFSQMQKNCHTLFVKRFKAFHANNDGFSAHNVVQKMQSIPFVFHDNRQSANVTQIVAITRQKLGDNFGTIVWQWQHISHPCLETLFLSCKVQGFYVRVHNFFHRYKIIMSSDIIANDKLVKIAMLETDIERVSGIEENVKICKQMCIYAKQDGLDIINKENPRLCTNTCDYYFSYPDGNEQKNQRANN